MSSSAAPGPSTSPSVSPSDGVASSGRRVLVVAHEPDGPGGQVAVAFEERGFAVDTHLLTDDYDQPARHAPFPAVDDYDVVALMGSVRSVAAPDDIRAWLDDELDLVRRRHAEGRPVLGVCFGGQVIAEALGGSVEVAPETEIGWYELTDGPDGPNPVGAGPWMEWHHDRFEPPPGSQILARTERAAQLFVTGRTVGTQFHPEVDVPHLEGWLEQASEEYLASYGTSAERILTEMREHDDRNRAQCRALVDWFLDDIAFPSATPSSIGTDTGSTT